MCNDYERHIEWDRYVAAVAKAELGMPADATPAQLPPADDVRVNDSAPVIVARGNVVELVPMRWGFAPAKPGRAPVFNFRSDGRNFANSKRCVIPASAFFEFTGAKTPKSKWRFVLRQSDILGVAGLWNAEESSFTMLTTEPGPDVSPFHDRQICVLAPQDWGRWLYLDRPEAELLKPLPDGSLAVTLAREGREEPPPTLPALAS